MFVTELSISFHLSFLAHQRGFQHPSPQANSPLSLLSSQGLHAVTLVGGAFTVTSHDGGDIRERTRGTCRHRQQPADRTQSMRIHVCRAPSCCQHVLQHQRTSSHHSLGLRAGRWVFTLVFYSCNGSIWVTSGVRTWSELACGRKETTEICQQQKDTPNALCSSLESNTTAFACAGTRLCKPRSPFTLLQINTWSVFLLSAAGWWLRLFLFLLVSDQDWLSQSRNFWTWRLMTSSRCTDWGPGAVRAALWWTPSVTTSATWT